MGRVRSLRGMAVALSMLLGAGLAMRSAHAQDLSAYANEVLNLVNKERQANGLAPLTRAVELDRAAQKYAQYMGDARFFSHTGPDGSNPASRIAAEGYQATTWGENIAAGQQSPQAVMTAWMNSSGHRANILYSAFKEIGIGVAKVVGSPMGIYWVQDFGARRSIPPGSQPAPTPPKPSATAINPNQGKVGDTVALDGDNFGTSVGKVFFAGVEGGIQSWSNTRISCLVPNGAQSGMVTVQNSVGTSNGLAFQVDPSAPETPPTPAPTPSPTPAPSPAPGDDTPQPTVRPRMTWISTRSGPSGVQVTIKGTNFGGRTGKLYFGRTGSSTIQLWTNTEITATLTGSPGRRYLLPISASGLISQNMVIFTITP